ncbi:MAG: PEP-CTERM sorting domain-containing protein [Phycisphaerae bacterium]|nr:PEP-CTERM sorting domain-containing protein [Phycisphaerae bacterium]
MATTKWVACITTCLAQCAFADVQTFVNDYPAFADAAGSLSVIDFETQPSGQPSQPGVQVTPAHNYDSCGVHFSAPAGRLELAGNPISGFHLDAIIPLPLPSSRTWIVADPLLPALAVGAHFAGHSYLFAYDEAGQLIAQGFAGGTPGEQFLGIVSDTPIDYVIFDRLSWLASINAFHFSPIPEPASAALLAAGAGWLMRVRRRARRVVPAS